MEHSTLLERQTLERYLAGRLPPEEAATLEEQLVARPELADQLEAVRQLELGLRTLAQRGALEGLVSRRPPPMRWAMAAGLVGAVTALLFFTLRPAQMAMVASLLDLPPALRDQAPANEYLLVKVRGEPVEIVLPESAAPLYVSLHGLPDVAQADTRISLVCGSQTLARVRAPAPDADGLTTVFLDSSVLQPGDCEFRASGGQQDAEFPVRFVRR